MKERILILLMLVSLNASSAQATRSGRVVGWGSNDYGQVTPSSESGSTAIDAGEDFSLALRTDGSIAAWGSNDFGQVTPPDGNDFKSIDAGGLHGLALRTNGSITGWGYNGYYQATPPSGIGFTAIAAGYSTVSPCGPMAASPAGVGIGTVRQHRRRGLVSRP